jgi:hypothetical protein
MKKIFTLITTILFLSLPLLLPAQNPPHPNGGNAPNGGGSSNSPVGGAPVGSGTELLIMLGAGYAVWKFLGAKKAVLNPEP